MNIFRGIIYAMGFAACLLICINGRREQTSGAPTRVHPQSYMPKELDSLYQPLCRDSFILQELHDEFRNPTERLFPMEQRMAHKTWILEFTWREKVDSLITVWYVREADTLRRLRYFRYSENQVF
jgi:lipoprotein